MKIQEKIRRAASYVLFAGIALGASGAPFNEAAAQTLRLSTLAQPDSDGARAANRFAELVSQRSGGKLTVRVFPASQLGDWTEVYEQVADGAIDMAMQPLSTASDRSLAITWFPFSFIDYDTARDSLAPGGPVFTIVETALGKQGLTPLGVFGKGMGGVVFATDKEIADPGNVNMERNLRVRVWPGGTTHRVMLDTWGFQTTTLPWAELYTGLQTGVADGAIGGTPEMALENFADIAKTWVQYNDHFEMDWIFINSNRLAGLSAEHQQILSDAAVEIANQRFVDVAAADQAAMNRMREMGVTVVEFDTATLQSIADRVRSDIWPQIEDEIGAEAMATLRTALGLD
jgi:TRAP-type C4-dicarboxylate transport system substrate-binding protein